MPHNPRRPRVPDVPDAVLTGDKIDDALERAVALRRKTAKDPNDVRAIALNVTEAARSTKHRRAPADWDRLPERDPWFLVGWVVLQRDWGFADGWGWDRYDRTWDVWLNVDEGRVWLKLSRLGRRPKDDPYP